MSCCNKEKSKDLVVSINRDKLKQGDLYESTLFAFSMNPLEFERKLDKLGLRFDGNPYEDIKFLSELHKLGRDKDGTLKDENGNRIKFDLIEFIRSIKVDYSDSNPIKTLIV